MDKQLDQASPPNGKFKTYLRLFLWPYFKAVLPVLGTTALYFVVAILLPFVHYENAVFRIVLPLVASSASFLWLMPKIFHWSHLPISDSMVAKIFGSVLLAASFILINFGLPKLISQQKPLIEISQALRHRRFDRFQVQVVQINPEAIVHHFKVRYQSKNRKLYRVEVTFLAAFVLEGDEKAPGRFWLAKSFDLPESYAPGDLGSQLQFMDDFALFKRQFEGLLNNHPKVFEFDDHLDADEMNMLVEGQRPALVADQHYFFRALEAGDFENPFWSRFGFFLLGLALGFAYPALVWVDYASQKDSRNTWV